jgi:hypothetical protein
MSVQEWFWLSFVPHCVLGALLLVFRKRLGVTRAQIEDFPGYAWLSKNVHDL